MTRSRAGEPPPRAGAQDGDQDRELMVTVRVRVDDLLPDIIEVSLRRYPLHTPDDESDAAEATSVDDALDIVRGWLADFER